MSNPRHRVVLFALATLTIAAPVVAQISVTLSSPRTIEFDTDVIERDEPVRYRVEVFPAGDATTATPTPVWRVDVTAAAPVNGRRVTIDIGEMTRSLPAGEYVATVATIHSGTVGPRSAPSESFVTTDSSASEPAPGIAQPLSAPSPPPTADQYGRLGTLIAVAIATALLLPYLLR